MMKSKKQTTAQFGMKGLDKECLSAIQNIKRTLTLKKKKGIIEADFILRRLR